MQTNKDITPFYPWYLTGSIGSDKFCMNANNTNTCVSNFDFFVYNATNGYDVYDGYIGLAPTASGAPPSFVTQLEATGAISIPSMTFQLYPYNLFWNATTSQGMVNFGGVPEDAVQKGKSVKHSVRKAL